MIPILFEKDATTFTTNGLGRIASCTRCIVTEERNGIYEAEFDVPVNDKLFDEIQIGRIIVCTHDEAGDGQPFDIYKKSEPISGIVTFYAHHISYRLNEITVEPFTATSCATAIQGLKTHSIGTNPFTFNTDKSVSNDYTVEVPSSLRGLLGGQENSLLDIFGTGEYKFDKFNVSLLIHRGSDTDVSIRYGKNLVDYQNELDYGQTYNAVTPFWLGSVYDDDTGTESTVLVTLTEKYISSGQSLPGARIVNVPMDLSGDFEQPPTEAELRTLATSRLNNSYVWIPEQNITVNFVQLWQTDEYKDFVPLQRVRLCDTVLVDIPMYNISGLRIKVIKVVWNTLLDRYDEMELGTPLTPFEEVIASSSSVSASIASAINAYANSEAAALSNAIQNATDLITGGLGGYVTIVRNANGKPIELVIADNEDLSQAINVWRWNRNGIGYSSTGYNGTFETAWTIDGQFLANYIKAGTISDDSGKNYWNINSGQFVTKQGTIGDFTIDSSGLKYVNYLGTSKTTVYGSYLQSEYDLRGNGGFYAGQRIITGGTDCRYLVSDGTLYGLSISALAGIGFHRTASATDPWTSSQTVLATIHALTNAIAVAGSLTVTGKLVVTGTKSRQVETDNYSDRVLYCYETPVPLFGDIGEAIIDEDGFCYIDLDDIFSETIFDKGEYQVFLQKEGEGDCWVSDKKPRYFVIQGTPNLKVAWELKAKQKGYHNIRLEPADYGLDEYQNIETNIEDYVAEQEGLLYGNY